MRNMARRMTAVVLCFFITLTSVGFSASAASKTGTGMAEWALRAYNEGWKYVFGAEEVGAVDCSGLIRSYINGGGGALALLNASQESGYMDSMPNVHGLGLWCDGHAGVYVGKASDGTNMAVDARNSRVNVVYSTMDSRSWNPWVKWFKVQGVVYPTTGWETFNGDTYYYYNGEFVTGIFTVNGVTYDFGKSGALIGEAKPTTATTTTTAAQTTSTKATTTTTASTSLKKGMSGEDVKEVQKRLIELGFMTAKATGYYGKKTEQAVKAFQEAAGLTADGVVGSGTKAKLFSDSAPRVTSATKTTTTTASTSLKQGMSGSEVTAMQKRLIELGYMDAKATGYFGKQTERALKAFQQAVGLTPDGVFGEVTKEKLFADNAPKLTTTTATTATTTTTAAVTMTTTTASTATTATTATTAAGSQGAVTTTTPVAAPDVTTATTTTAPPTPIEMLLSDGEDYSDRYVDLEFGTTGDVVTQLQQRLTELGYYDGNIDGYYGVFLRIAVTQFQENSGISGSGIADVDTQALLYSDYAPYADGTIVYLMDYDEEDYMIDEGDYYEEPEEEAPVLSLEPSKGLSGYSTEADISSFARRFGSGGALQTLGVADSSEPVVIIVYDGDSFELTEELQGIIDDCVFF